MPNRTIYVRKDDLEAFNAVRDDLPDIISRAIRQEVEARKNNLQYDRELFDIAAQTVKDDTPQQMTYFEFLDIFTDAWLVAEQKTGIYPAKEFRVAVGNHMDSEVVRRGGES
ncbi:hypothetical protein [Rhodococcus sp. CH91]|uniref:hypothetical protein n=1 Tax=Rhodococcus sp. CH91 TaxID=2910256 RepID=UPI001F4B1AE2|nr:hypothetical protein [Rhodococcus sp. CH91]